MRGTTNRNARGSTRDRAARKRWLLKTYAANTWYSHLVVPKRRRDKWKFKHLPACRCYRCGDLLHFDTLTVDRIIPGCRGGTYRRNNIRPSCADCNSKTGGAVRGNQ